MIHNGDSPSKDPKCSYSVITAKQHHEMIGVFWFLGRVSI